MMTGKNLIVIVIIAFITVLCLTNTSFPITIQLKNGTWLTGEIISTDNNGFEFKCWGNGGILNLKWTSLNEEDRNQLKDTLSLPTSLNNSDEIDAYRIYLKSNQVLEGVIISKNAAQIQIKILGGVKSISADDVLNMEHFKTNPLKIYTNQEWYAEKVKSFDLGKASDNFQLAEYCRNVLKLYDKAKEHYSKASELSPAYKEESTKKISEINCIDIQKRIEYANSILNAKDAKSVEQAKNILAELKKEKDTDKETGGKISELEKRIKEIESNIVSKTEKEFNKKIAQQFYSAAKTMIRKMCEQNMPYADTISYINTMLYKQIIAKLAKDNKITEEETINIMSNKSQDWLDDLPPHEASYGDGSWIISTDMPSPTPSMTPEEFANYQKKLKEIAGAKAEAAKKNELITADTWWKDADATQKSRFSEAYFAERYMHVVEKKAKPCSACNGEGIVNKTICKQCWGTMVEISVIYK